MTITTVAINCDIGLANATEFTASQLEFTLSDADYDTISNDSVPAATVVLALDASGVATANLWPVDRGTRNTFYRVVLIGTRTINGRATSERFALGNIAPPSTGAPFALADLLGQSTGGIVVGSTIYETIADAVQAALDAADAAAQSAADAQTWTPAYAAEAVADADAARDRAQAWAESATAPDPALPASKSAKTWAAEAEASVAGAAQISSLAREVFINTNRFSKSLETLTGFDNPASITATAVNAALAADPDVVEINLLAREYELNAVINAPNRDVRVYGRGGNRSRINLPNTSSGFRFRPTLANADNFYGIDIEGLNFNAIGDGCSAIDAAWPVLPFSLHKYGTFRDLTMSVEPGGSFDRGIKLRHAQGTLVENLYIQNYRTDVLGVGVEYDGFCLANRIAGYLSGFLSHSVLIQPFEVCYILLSGATGSFGAGEPITSSSGGVGVIVGTLSGGATASMVIEVLSGTWIVGNTVSASGGGAGTIASTEIREWGSEGYYFKDFECVGVQRGIYWPNGSKIIKPGVLIVADGIHVNASVDPIRIEFVSQIMMDKLSLYGGVSNMDMVTLVGCDRAQINGQGTNLLNDGTGYAFRGSLGDDAWGKAHLTEIDVQIENTGFAGLAIVDAGAVNVNVENGPGQWTAYTPSVAAQTGSITTLGSRSGRFCKRGQSVEFQAEINIVSAGTAADGMIITLPDGHVLKGGTPLMAVEQDVTGKMAYAKNVAGASSLEVRYYDSTTVFANGAKILISGIYEIE